MIISASELSSIFGAAESDIHVNVLGEHGDSQFIAWSNGYIGTCKLDEFPGFNQIDQAALAVRVRDKAYKIIQSKGATAYGYIYVLIFLFVFHYS